LVVSQQCSAKLTFYPTAKIGSERFSAAKTLEVQCTYDSFAWNIRFGFQGTKHYVYRITDDIDGAK